MSNPKAARDAHPPDPPRRSRGRAPLAPGERLGAARGRRGRLSGTGRALAGGDRRRRRRSRARLPARAHRRPVQRLHLDGGRRRGFPQAGHRPRAGRRGDGRPARDDVGPSCRARRRRRVLREAGLRALRGRHGAAGPQVACEVWPDFQRRLARAGAPPGRRAQFARIAPSICPALRSRDRSDRRPSTRTPGRHPCRRPCRSG